MPDMEDTSRPQHSLNPQRRLRDDVCTSGPRKKMYAVMFKLPILGHLTCRSRTADPLMHHGRHFGRTIHALCNVHPLILNGLLRVGELRDEPEESFSLEYKAFPFFWLTS
jgi:hypothetical protein